MEPAADEQQLLSLSRSDGRVRLSASGAWTARNAAALDGTLDTILAGLEPRAMIDVDLNRVQALDTYGATLLARLTRQCRTRECKVEMAGLPERFVALATAVERAQLEQVTASAAVPPWTALLAAGGRWLDAVGRDLVLFVNMLGAVGHALARVCMRPASFRLTATVHHVDRVALQAVPIVLLITFLIGGIIAQQGFFHFRKFGADQYVVDMVGILVLREIGVLIVAIMVAGRSGSSYTAELGSMKMREEIDALRTMGLDPVSVLILPRIIALVIALPILSFLGALSALYGGGLVAWAYGDMNPDIFIARLRDAISLTHFKVGMIKAPFMALVIGIVACTEGLKVRGSAESLGLQTTASVVKSIFLVIVLDGLFAIYFAAIGM